MRDKSKRLTVINTGSDRFDGYTDKEIRKLVSSGSNIIGGESGSSSEGLSGKYLSSETYDEAKGVINFLEGLMIDGRLVDGLLRERDTENATDTNIMTSSRIAKELSKLDDKYLRKDKDDRSSGMISSNKGFEVGNYVSGASGAIIYKDAESGQTVGELDKLYVRMKAYFETLEIVNVNTIGGKQILSPGGSVKCLGVEETEDAYRCYFLAELDGEKIENRFVVNDQIYSQTFDAVEGVSHNVSNHYFWRLCTAVAEAEVEFEGKKCWWIDLSKTDADNAVWNSDIPVAGDILNQRGNRTDIDRMNFIEQSSVDAYSPNITLFHGVNSYSLDGKEYVSLGVDKSSNKAFMNVYGSMYVGDRNKTSYMKYTPEDGLEINGRLNVGVKLGDTPLKDLISAASPEGYQEFIEKVTGDIEGLQQQIDGAIESYFYQYSPSLENYPAASWNTDDKKKAHLNDTFTNLNDGRSWRWTVNNGVYGWTEITDTATAQALALAGKAKDTADGKRRVFTNTPYPPYDEGDLWAGGSTSPLKVCVKSKTETQLFDESDWAYADNTEKLRDEMSTLVSTTKTELNTSIASTKTAMEGYTDNAKKALQQSIDLLESTKADIDNVYSIADADGKISAAEADAIKKAEELADAARALAEINVQAWADGEISDAEQRAIEEAQKRVDAAKSELEAAIAEIDSKYAKLVAETKGELNNEIGQATVAANNYTDAAKTALQGAIDELNKAKANITEVYSIAEADGKISASEQAAINAAKEQADAAIALSETTIKAYADGVVDKEEAARIKQAEENLAAAKEYAEEKAKEARDEIKNSYLFQALTEAPGTTIENGLILSSLIQLRDQGGNIKSGINGTINDSKGDKSIANWWGGNMDDMTDYYTWDGTQWVLKSGLTAPSNLPSGLIRMDGTGYLAKGKFWWDNNGKIYADPTALFLMFDVEDESASLSQTILNLRDKQTEFTDMWELRTDIHGNKYLYSKHPLVTQGGVTMYANGGDLDLPSIYDGLPIDGTTIYWENGILKAKGGGGIAESVSWADITGKPEWLLDGKISYSEVEGTPDLSVYALNRSLSAYVTKTELTNLDYADKDWVIKKGYLTSIPSEYITESELTAKGYATASSVTKLRNDFDALVDGDTSTAIDNFNEIIAFLNGVQDNQDLSSIIASIEQQIAAKYTKPSGGIPKSDLVQAVQTSLGKADSALQSHQSIYTLTFQSGTFASGSFTANSGNKTINIPTTTSHVSEGSNLYFTNARAVSALGDTLKSYVTLSGSQTVSGEKNFTGGLKVNGSPIVYDAAKKYWKLEGDLLITGGLTMYGSDSSFTPSTIMDAIAVDGTTISKDGGVLRVIGGGSGSISEITKQMVIDALGFTPISSSDIPKTLPNPYVLKFGTKEYDGNVSKTILASDLGITWDDILGRPTLLSSFTDDVVAGKYLPLTGGMMRGDVVWGNGTGTNSTLPGHIYRNLFNSDGNVYDHFFPNDSLATNTFANLRVWDNSAKTLKVLRFGGDGTFTWDNKTVIHSSNIGSYALPLSGGAMTGTIITPGNDSIVIKPAKHNYDQIGGEGIAFWKIFSTNFYGTLNGNCTGSAGSAGSLVYNSSLGVNDSVSNGTISYAQVESVDVGVLPSSSNANGVLTLNTHRGDYHHQLGFTSYGLFYRDANGVPLSDSIAWKQIAFTDSDITGNAATATNVAWSGVTGKPSTLSGYGITDNVAMQGKPNNFIHSSNEWTVVPSGYTGDIWLNYRTQDKSNGNILNYHFCDGKGGSLATISRGSFDGNAASSTKLQTARTIWGQSFDGTSDVKGNINLNTSHLCWFNDPTNYSINGNTGNLVYTGYYGHKFCTSNGEVLTITDGGNVGIGTTNPLDKLHVAGNLRLKNNDSYYGNYIYFGDDRYCYIGEVTDDSMTIYASKGIQLMGKVNITSDTTIDGNLLVRGGITMYSAKELKNIVDERGLSLDELRAIKPTRYTWKDGRDNRIHFGGIADDIQQVLPEVVYNANGVLTMDYGNAGFVIASSLIKPVVDHEQRIKVLEKENEELKQEIKRLRE